MAVGKDKVGRPLVVVTGLGLVTSLGASKSRQLGEAHNRRIRYQDDHTFSHRWFKDAHRRHY